MKIKLNPHRGIWGQAIALWVIVMIFVVFIVIIFGIAYCMIKTLQKICPPPGPDEYGHTPGLGDAYQGGEIIGYTNPPRLLNLGSDYGPAGFLVSDIYIYADNNPNPVVWTNLIWHGPLSEFTNQVNSNGIPVEQWPNGQQPAKRFYNIVASNSVQ